MISVVVFSFNRKPALQACLEALLAQTGAPDHEILVIDQGSTDGSRAWLDARAAACAHVRVKTCLDRSLNAKRNLGLAEARYAIVAFIDDDAVADPGWLQAMGKTFEDGRVAVATGRTLPLNEGYRRSLCPATVPREWGRHWTDRLICWRCGCGTNMALTRSAAERIGGFDPDVGVGGRLGGAGCDTEFFYRAMLRGVALSYRPDMIVRHGQTPDLAAHRRRTWDYYYGVAAFVRWKHPSQPSAWLMVFLRGAHALAMMLAHGARGQFAMAGVPCVALRATLAGLVRKPKGSCLT